MTTHTPGPWTVKGRYVEALDDRQTIVCEVTGSSENPIARADARLIAAAPELLAALSECVAELRLLNLKEDGQQKYNTPASLKIVQAHAAIRAATGQEDRP